MAVLRVPVASYRVQFHTGFRFTDARTILPYLQALGITDLYASPVLKARRGSSHGYDVTDPLSLNPELGAADEFEVLTRELKGRGMGMILDIVPNHMAATSENPWWMDFLENGPSSPYASFFEIVWHPASAKGAMEDKVLLPILGAPYGRVLENQELSLTLDENGFSVRYYDVRLPLDPKSYAEILGLGWDAFRGTLAPDHPLLRKPGLLDLIDRLPQRTVTDPQAVAERRNLQAVLKRRLWELYDGDPQVRRFVDENMRMFNGMKGDPKSFDRLDQLLADQAYWLAFWRVVTEKINYRRFFDITDLVGIRIEDLRVFREIHPLILQLAAEEKVTGLRVDHVDGLQDPLQYLRRLQSHLLSRESPGKESQGFYVVVEKILLEDEVLPEEWPVCGTTGYDFLNAVNGVFVDPRGLETLHSIYARFIGSDLTFSEVVYEQKKRIMEELFTGEVHALGHHLGLLAEQYRHARYMSPKELVQALVEVTACLSVYRTYIRDLEVPARDRVRIERAVEAAGSRNPDVSTPVFAFLRRVLLLDLPSSLQAEQREEWLLFVLRWQQFTGPVMAKGLEDTCCYIYNRLISLNEVGGNPGRVVPPGAEGGFHRFNRGRREHWSRTLNVTSTHDTKRSEDVRARIDVLSEVPEMWERYLVRWSRWNREAKLLVRGRLAPDPNEEIFLYQTLLGAWPLSEAEVPAFRKRLKQYVTKAAREAKVYTSWIHSRGDHESALVAFVESILESGGENRFLEDFLRFQKRIAYYGALGSLAQLVLKVASPGVPDFYQGTELWDFSLVDPDNRRAVDFRQRFRLLEELSRCEEEGRTALLHDLLSRWEDGRIKLYVTSKSLSFRRAHGALFLEGDYLPLAATGTGEEHVCAFARRRGAEWAVVVVPRLLTRLVSPGRPPLGSRVWGEGSLVFPREAPGNWLNVITGERPRAFPSQRGTEMFLSGVLHSFPVALLSAIAPDR